MNKLLCVLVAVLTLGCASRQAEQAYQRGQECLKSRMTTVTEADQREAERLRKAGNRYWDIGLSASGVDLKCAIREFGTAARIRPEVARYRGDLGAALARAGMLDQAVLELREALRLDPSDARARHNLHTATRQIELGRAELAADETAARLLPHQ